MRHSLFFALILISARVLCQPLFSSSTTYTHQDSLRGSVTSERIWWDLLHYELYVAVNPESKSISGTNTISYKVISENDLMQIDLQAPMKITRVTQDGVVLTVADDGNAHFVQLKQPQRIGSEMKLVIEFSGNPHEALRAPWDGGFSWTKDKNGKHFIATSNQGIGASLWWPCKDHMYDEPDRGVLLSINVPQGLVAVGNGRLENVIKERDKTSTYVWKVVNPINNYGVNINVGDYIRFSEKYPGEKGVLDMDFWVLRDNLEKAMVHFKDARRTIEAFEYWFGPYPFYEDSYKLVETPYLGMEHQSSVTYGNGYQNGYLGYDLSGTGWGLKWDYIIVHESGHEWFANNITYRDIADMWIHEGFTMYSESLFIEYFYGKAAGSEYTRGLRMNISNTEPLIGDYEVNKEGSPDMYNKGNNLLHTLRQWTNDDEKWRSMLRGLNEEFYHRTVTSADVEAYISEKLGLALTPFFDQYLRDTRIPTLEYRLQGNNLLYRWTNCIGSFNMPVKLIINGEETWLNPTTNPQSLTFQSEIKEVKADPNFYVYSTNVMD